MRKLFLVYALLVVVGSICNVGCKGDPGQMTPATKEEVENDPAIKEPGV